MYKLSQEQEKAFNFCLEITTTPIKPMVYLMLRGDRCLTIKEIEEGLPEFFKGIRNSPGKKQIYSFLGRLGHAREFVRQEELPGRRRNSKTHAMMPAKGWGLTDAGFYKLRPVVAYLFTFLPLDYGIPSDAVMRNSPKNKGGGIGKIPKIATLRELLEDEKTTLELLRGRRIYPRSYEIFNMLDGLISIQNSCGEKFPFIREARNTKRGHRGNYYTWTGEDFRRDDFGGKIYMLRELAGIVKKIGENAYFTTGEIIDSTKYKDISSLDAALRNLGRNDVIKRLKAKDFLAYELTEHGEDYARHVENVAGYLSGDTECLEEILLNQPTRREIAEAYNISINE